MAAVIGIAEQRRVQGLSLSVEDGNPTRRLYERQASRWSGVTGVRHHAATHRWRLTFVTHDSQQIRASAGPRLGSNGAASAPRCWRRHFASRAACRARPSGLCHVHASINRLPGSARMPQRSTRSRGNPGRPPGADSPQVPPSRSPIRVVPPLALARRRGVRRSASWLIPARIPTAATVWVRRMSP